MKYTKEYLVSICDKSIVPFERWNDRDTPSAQISVATIRAYLLAGCKFRILMKGVCVTDDSTIWLDIFHYDFEDKPSWHTYYMPTEKRISEANGGDWY